MYKNLISLPRAINYVGICNSSLPNCSIESQKYISNYGLSSLKYAMPNFQAGALKSKAGPMLTKVTLPVETDPHKLVKYVCGLDYRKEDAVEVEIKPDSEYPDWLWTVRLGPEPPIEEMDPNSKEYWVKMRSMVSVTKKRVRATWRFY